MSLSKQSRLGTISLPVPEAFGVTPNDLPFSTQGIYNQRNLKTQRHGTITNGQNGYPRFVLAAGKTVIIPSDVRSAPDWEPSHDAEGESYS